MGLGGRQRPALPAREPRVAAEHPRAPRRALHASGWLHARLGGAHLGFTLTLTLALNLTLTLALALALTLTLTLTLTRCASRRRRRASSRSSCPRPGWP